jgi:hypothetical protein
VVMRSIVQPFPCTVVGGLKMLALSNLRKSLVSAFHGADDITPDLEAG